MPQSVVAGTSADGSARGFNSVESTCGKMCGKSNKNKTFDIVDVMKTIADEKQVSVAQIALVWLLHQPAVTSVIIGATKMEQLKIDIESVNINIFFIPKTEPP
mgnify:CR=1 FL=1